MEIKPFTSLQRSKTSINGYPVFYFYNNRNTSDRLDWPRETGQVFYTEDEKILKKFETEIPEQLVYKHTDCIHSYVREMTSEAAQAFRNLEDSEVFKETLKNKRYGCAHLIQKDKVLIFESMDLPEIYEGSIDLTDPKQFKKATKKLSDMYKAGAIEPDSEITHGAFKKIKPILKSFTLKNEETIEDKKEILPLKKPKF